MFELVYNHFHTALIFFGVLANFAFTTGERVASRVAEQLKKS